MTTSYVSVIMPVYNGENFLFTAVESILNQSFVNFEFIIINDGSTDKTEEILQDYQKRDPRIILISRENKGLVESLNEGISIASSDFIARMDADDISHPERLQKQYDFISKNPTVAVVGSQVRVIDEKSRFLILNKPKTDNEELIESALSGVSPIIHPTAMIRKSALLAVNCYNPNDYPAEDLALWINLSEYGELANIDEPLLDYRIHDKSISTSVHDKQISKTLEICERACKIRGIAFDSKFKVGRASEDNESKYGSYIKYGWWAFGSREFNTAFVYGIKALRLNMRKIEAWKLLYCSLLKRKN